MGRVGVMTLQIIKANIKLGDLLADTLANLNAKVSDATLDTSSATRTPAAHEATHVDGGADDIDSALAAAAIPNLATSKITSTRFPVDRLPALTDEKIWKGTGTNVEEIDVPAADTVALNVSEVLRNSNDTSRNTGSESYVKVKEVKLNEDLPFCRIKFGLNSGGSSMAWGRIRKNGVAIGTERNTTTPQTYSEDFAGFVTDDLIQIYAYSEIGAGDALVTNMRFYYSDFITHIGGVELVTVLESEDDPTISVTNQDP